MVAQPNQLESIRDVVSGLLTKACKDNAAESLRNRVVERKCAALKGLVDFSQERGDRPDPETQPDKNRFHDRVFAAIQDGVKAIFPNADAHLSDADAVAGGRVETVDAMKGAARSLAALAQRAVVQELIKEKLPRLAKEKPDWAENAVLRVLKKTLTTEGKDPGQKDLDAGSLTEAQLDRLQQLSNEQNFTRRVGARIRKWEKETGQPGVGGGRRVNQS